MVEVTCTVTVQDPKVLPTFAGTMPPLKDNVVPTADTIPPQVVVVLAGLAKFRFPFNTDKSSVREFVLERMRANEFGLNMITLNVDVPPAEMDIGLKEVLIPAGRENP